VALLAVTALPSRAFANGRFPEANAYFFSPKDPAFVLLRTTFGVLVSKDRGGTWDWVCDGALGLIGSEDPMFQITTRGTILGSTFSGVTISSDDACTFTLARGSVADLVFVDLAARPSAPDRVVAMASTYAGQDANLAILYETNLWETSDHGRSFARITPTTLERSLVGQTLDVAPSDADRLYVSAVRSPEQPNRVGFVLTSKDRGKSFVQREFSLIGSETAPFLSGVHPTNPDRLYVRTANAADKPSRLLVSDDAGATFRTVFSGLGPLMGIAFNGDHTKVWIGGPLDGVHVASTVDFEFTKTTNLGVQCLAFQPDGLWACAAEKDGFVAGLSTDDGKTFQPRLRMCEIRGALACAPGSSTSFECVLGGKSMRPSLTWPAQSARLGCSADPNDAGTDPSAAEPPPSDDGCATAASHTTGLGGAGLSLAVVAIHLWRRRSRAHRGVERT